MRISRPFGLALLAALLTLPAAAHAQRAQTRDGFFLGLGLGYGSLGLGCDGCDFDREGGLSGYFKIGGALSQQVLLGGETTGWFKSEDGVDISQGNLQGNVYFYPSPTGGFFVKGGAGLSTISLDAGIGGSDSETGFGWGGGVGYDVRVGDNFSITPVVSYFRGEFDGFSTNVLQLAFGVTWH